MTLSRFLAAGLALLAALTSASLPARAQSAEARFAFVIGNDGYEGSPLPTAANDAGLVAETLRSANFDVTGARNLDQDTLRASYREFLDKVAAAGPNAVAAIYFSGHGLQVDGENYLVPVGARVQRDTDVTLNAVRMSDLLRALGGLPAKSRIIMLDLAYDSPFGKQGQPLAPGLEIVEPEAGSLISFNAAPGTWAPVPKGNYGPYAQALSETLRIPGLSLDELFSRVRTRTAELSEGKQVPWHSSKTDPHFVLLERGPDAPAATVTSQQIEAARIRPIKDFSEGEAYAATLDRDTIAAYQEFLSAYPGSRYAPAIKGLLAARREALTWRRTVAVNSPNAYWSYLRRYPKGPHASDARRRLTRLAAALEPPTEFDAIQYDVAPPPDSEDVYFERPGQAYFLDDALPPLRSEYMPPPPAWWVPPPPAPVEVIYEDSYYLPTPFAPPPPPWVRPPAYVVDAPEFYRGEHRRDGGPASIVPYVAIPAALAAGIAAGRIINQRRDPPPVPGGPRPIPGGVGGPGQQGRPNFVPPVTQPPRPISQLQQGQPQPVRPTVLPGQQPPQQQPGLPRPGIPQPGVQQQAPQGLPRPAGALPGAQPLPGQAVPPQGAQPRPGIPQPGLQQQAPQGLPRPGGALPGAPPLPGQAVPPQGAQPRPGIPQPGLQQQAPQGLPRPGIPPQVPQPNPPSGAPPGGLQQQQILQQQRIQEQQRQQQLQQQQRAADQQRQQQLQQQQQRAVEQQRQQQIQQQQIQQQRQQQIQQQQIQQQRQQQIQQQQIQQQRQQQIQQQQQQQRQQQQQQQQQRQQQPNCGHPGQPLCR